ncbi:site-specific integrase [Streptomyces sp. SID11233]|nr:site-specific integrase [Streptomyces sp. SID11233]
MIDTDSSGRLTGRMSWALRLEVAVSNRLLAYAPKPETVPPAQWRRIAPVVRSLGFLAVASGPYGPDVIMTPLARLVAWSEAQGLPLEPSVLLDQSTVERFILVGCRDMATSSRRTCSSQLRRASEALLLDQLGQHPPIRLKATVTPVAPYPPSEVAHWLIWAQSLPTEAQRRNACLLFCLGIGCGLAVEDLVYVQGQDISEGPTGRALVKIHGRRPRTVVCRYAYEELLLAQAADIPADAYVFRPDWQNRTSKHIASDWLAKYPRLIGRCDGAVLQSQRLRTTWLVDLLNAGIPLHVILKASGLATLHSLSRYLVFLHDVSEAEASDLLRGVAA